MQIMLFLIIVKHETRSTTELETGQIKNREHLEILCAKQIDSNHLVSY